MTQPNMKIRTMSTLISAERWNKHYDIKMQASLQVKPVINNDIVWDNNPKQLYLF